MTDRTSCSKQDSCGLPPRSVTRRQRSAIDQPIKSQATFGNIVTAVYNVAWGVWPPGDLQYPFAAIASIISLQPIGLPSSSSTRAAASRALTFFGFVVFASLAALGAFGSAVRLAAFFVFASAV